MVFGIMITTLLVLSSLFFAFFYLKSKTTRAKIITSVLMSSILAICAFHFVPKSNYDLTRHHGIVSSFESVDSVDEFIDHTDKNDLEIIPQVYSWAISKTGEKNLLQAIIVLIGYSLLFYMLIDYKTKKKMANWKFIPLVLLIIFGQHILFYFSGLYNYFAINLFAFAFYIDYVKKRKVLPHVLYFLSIFIHTSMLLPLGLVYLFKLLKSKINVKTLVLLILILLSFDVVIGFLADTLNNDLLMYAKNTYNSYILHNDHMSKYYDGFYLFMTITKMFFVGLAYWVQMKDDTNKEIKDFACMLSLTVVILSFSSMAMTRFSSLALFVSLPLIVDAMSKNSKKSNMISCFMIINAFIYVVYSLHTMAPLISF